MMMRGNSKIRRMTRKKRRIVTRMLKKSLGLRWSRSRLSRPRGGRTRQDEALAYSMLEEEQTRAKEEQSIRTQEMTRRKEVTSSECSHQTRRERRVPSSKLTCSALTAVSSLLSATPVPKSVAELPWIASLTARLRRSSMALTSRSLLDNRTRTRARARRPRSSGSVSAVPVATTRPSTHIHLHQGPRNEAEPSAEVKQLMGAANRAYAVGELDEALEHLTEVVRIDPAIRMPWYTLATIHEEKGNRDKAVMFKIVATHLLPLKKAGPEWAGLGAQSRDAGLLQQAIYCYNQAIKADKNDVDSMWDRAVLLKLSGSAKQVRAGHSFLW